MEYNWLSRNMIEHRWRLHSYAKYLGIFSDKCQSYNFMYFFIYEEMIFDIKTLLSPLLSILSLLYRYKENQIT